MKMLLITGCSNSSYWYADKIGEVVKFLGHDRDEFITREPSGYVNIIKTPDAELVEVVPALATMTAPTPEPEVECCDLVRVELSFPDRIPVALANEVRAYLQVQAELWAKRYGRRCAAG
jgi:hypothetical protein